MEKALKLTENETILLLIEHLKHKGWIIESYCLGQTRGCDIVAIKHDEKFCIEVKGARADDNSPTKRREYFNSGQIKTHFGKAIVKILSDKHLNPNSKFAIAHPNDDDIIRSIGNLTPYLRNLEIKHFWVSQTEIIEEN
ncbi:hypothetical protein NZ698_17650 [Chryseobacterium sp. PBS4-4]|uniref:Protein NO VEIN C-terminal domain-containing protein n=1 Tax=Chryseobacterium edaphi TaxID=2976532 RepID=A0ABT2W9Y4_9FLAO|nr:hypothetical protein [Chryseobacterium edaphi]MCU7619006.1 hypothetical protein [Chryseobacterium edaphi]